MSGQSLLRERPRRPITSDMERGADRERGVQIGNASIARASLQRPSVCVSTRSAPLIPASMRLDLVREAAYFRAQTRGFAPGREAEDWAAAEQEIEDLIMRRYAV